MASKDKPVKETPLMKQYNEIKRKYPDACLLFRVGDFYETFGEEGRNTADWIVVDLGQTIVHIMQRDAREMYQLEKLWA